MVRPTAVCLTAALVACARSPEPVAPQTGWVDVDAAALRAELTEARQRPRVVNFWATWCAPCMREIPELTAWSSAHPDVDVTFVSIDHPSVRARGDAVLRRVGLDGHRVLHLGEPDPTAVLHASVAGWTDAVPLTAVVAADGTRIATFAYAIDGATLDGVFAESRP